MMGDFDKDDVDLEELEERLYSQIYHSTTEEEPQIPQEPQSEETYKQTYGKPRYYEETQTNYYLENRTQENLTNIIDGKDPADNNRSITDPSITKENINSSPNSSQNDEHNTTQNVSINERNTSFNTPQYINLSSDVEKAGLKPPNKIENLNKRAKIRFKKKLDTEIKYLNIDKYKILDNYDFIKQTAPFKLKKLKIINKRLRYLINKRMKFKDDKEDKLINKHNEGLDREIVQISSEDEDTTIVIKEKSPFKKTKVDNECVPEDDDDVVFVKQIFTEIETIVIDPETSQKTDSELMKPPSDVETSSVGSSNSSNLDKTSKAQSTSQIELIGTPESTNDFLDNPMEMNQDKFNFALHGSDFGTPQSSKFLKPKPLNEVYESESSCSASDISTPYKKGCSVFSENDFDSSKEMFNESNLETFSKLITPKRKPAAAKSLETKSNEFQQIKTKANSTSDLKTNSDSSSESEYEDTKIRQMERKKISKLNESLTEDLATEIPVEVEDRNSKKKNKKSIKIEEVDDHTQFLQDLTEKRRKRKSEQNVKIESENIEAENLADSSVKKSKKNKTKNIDDDVKETPKKEEDIKSKKKKKMRTNFTEELKNAIQEDTVNTENSAQMKTKSGDFYIDESSMQDSIKVTNSQTNNTIDLTADDSYIFEMEDFIVIDECGDSCEDEKKPDNKCSGANWETEVVDVDDEKSVEKEKTKKRRSFTDYWTEDMDKFYTSWGLENFNIDDSLKTMSADPEKWKILDSDRLHIPTHRRGPVCRKCGQAGHVYTRAGYCPNTIPKCFLCGESGHFEPRCPNKICTMCGARSNYSTTYCSKCVYLRDVYCKICNMRGHKEDLCPDSWRRYHLTTEEGPIVKPVVGDQLKPPSEQWCSGCALPGHLEYQCRYYNRIYPATLPYVVDYTDVYGFSEDFTSDILDNTYINNVYDIYANINTSNHLREPNVRIDCKPSKKLSRKMKNDQHYKKLITTLQLDKNRKNEMNQKPYSTFNYINIDNSASGDTINITNININDNKSKKAPFRGFPSNASDITTKISTSLNNLKDWNAYEDCVNLYKKIVKMEKKPGNKAVLRETFTKLNSLLITKYNVVGIKGQKHLNVLTNWLEKNQGTTDQDVLPHSIVNKIRNSYYFVFDARRKQFNYRSLLRKIDMLEVPDGRNLTFAPGDLRQDIVAKRNLRKFQGTKRLKQYYPV